MNATAGDGSRGDPWWAEQVEVVAERVGTDPDRGLSATEAGDRLARFGPNELERRRGPGPMRRLLAQFADPLVGLLLVAIVISTLAWWSHGTESAPVEPIVIALIVLANAAIGFWQEGRAIDAVESLRRLTAAQSTVVRDGITSRIPTSSLVPGDIVVLAEGDTVGFDGRVASVASLETNEAALTGESLPVHKDALALAERTELGYRRNMVFAGTAVVRGRGRAIVVGTGAATEVGRIAALLDEAAGEPTPLQRQVDQLGRVLGIVVVVLAAVVVGAIFLTSDVDSTDEALDALLVAVSLAVAAVPEGLPAILTVVLALGVQRMSRRNAIVKRLVSVETLGSASVICTDKTGTLTRNEMTLVAVATASGTATLSGAGYEPNGALSVSDDAGADLVAREVADVLWAGGSSNDATLDRNGTDWSVSGDPTEIALLVAEAKVGDDTRRRAASTRLAEVPFDADRMLMSTLDRIDDGVSGPTLVQFTKGAPEVLVDRCVAERRAGETIVLDDTRRAAVREVVGEFADRGLRTIGVARRPRVEVPAVFDESAEYELEWLGVVGLADPPRTEVAEVIAEAARAGVRTVMVTGDHARTATTIATAVGIPTGEPTVDGAELGTVDSGARGADGVIASSDVFARISPEQKLEIVRSLQESGEIVAMTGDGVNDAPALSQADIGVAMGQIGTDVSRDAADMILADDHFGSIVAAIHEGRIIFSNIRKFVRYLLASNTGEVLVVVFGVLAAGVLGLEAIDGGLAVPLLATQILWINLLTDSTLALALGVDPAVDDVMASPPRRLGDPIVDRSMWTTIALVGFTTALASLVALDLETPGGVLAGDGDLVSGRTMAFTTVVLAQIFNAFNSRSDRVTAFYRPFDNRLLWLAAAGTVLLQVAVVNLGPLNRAFDTTPLDAGQWMTCWLLASTVLIVNELRKLFGQRRRGSRPAPVSEIPSA
jgi:magnesium-transporting ATPase (P-type)